MKLSLSGRLWESSKGYRITLAEHVEAAAKLGYAGIEVRYPLLPKIEEEGKIRSLLKEKKVEAVMGFCAGVPKDADSQADLTRVLKIHQALGVRFVRIAVFKEEDLSLVRKIGEQSQPLRIQTVMHVHINTLCDTAAKAASAVKKVDHPNVRLLFDPIHLVMAGEKNLDAATEQLAPWITFVNIQDYRPDPNGEVKADGNWTRCMPGDPKGLDFKRVLATLKRVGYDGWLNVMCATGDNEDPPAVAKAYRDHLQPMIR
jgi:sugar phosphate isomerase/epimerase